MALQNQVVINSFPIPNSQLIGSAGYLDLYYNSDWVDNAGVLHFQSPSRSLNTFFQRVPLTNVAGQLNCPSFSTYATLNALVNPNARVTGIVRDQSFVYEHTLFKDFFIPYQTGPLLMPDLIILNKGRALFLAPTTYLDQTGVMALVQAMLANFTISTPVEMGVSLPLVSGAGPFGQAQVTVLSANVKLNSRISLVAQGPISGAVYPNNLIPGVSFDIVSNNGGDNSAVFWQIFNP